MWRAYSVWLCCAIASEAINSYVEEYIEEHLIEVLQQHIAPACEIVNAVTPVVDAGHVPASPKRTTSHGR